MSIGNLIVDTRGVVQRRGGGCCGGLHGNRRRPVVGGSLLRSVRRGGFVMYLMPGVSIRAKRVTNTRTVIECRRGSLKVVSPKECVGLLRRAELSRCLSLCVFRRMYRVLRG